MQNRSNSYSIIGGGVIGYSIGIAILNAFPDAKVQIVEKESSIGAHASGRNSGVLHAGFYYSPETLKAQFCKTGNIAMKKFIKKNGLAIREIGKVVVARNNNENLYLDTLSERGYENGIEIELLDASQLPKFEPLATTHGRFLWSPTTSVANPNEVLEALDRTFKQMGGRVSLGQKVELINHMGEIISTNKSAQADFYINCAGAHALKLAHLVGLGRDFAMIPFSGAYREVAAEKLPLRTLVYPVPSLINPFLGVHFTLTTRNTVKIGPTAMPVFGAEQYNFKSSLRNLDSRDTFRGVAAMFNADPRSFVNLARSGYGQLILKKIREDAATLVPSVGSVQGWKKMKPGIRAQLVRLEDGKLEQDFVVRSKNNSLHVLNAVSPGWTCAPSFADWIVKNYIV